MPVQAVQAGTGLRLNSAPRVFIVVNMEHLTTCPPFLPQVWLPVKDR